MSEPSPASRRPERWIDKDLTAAARRGEQPPAFAREHAIAQAMDLLSGTPARSPILSGPSGVGKTTVIHEIVRRGLAGEGPDILRTHRVVRLSLAALSRSSSDGSKAMDLAAEVFEALATEPVLLFIPDVQLAYSLDWEGILARYLDTAGHPILGEGSIRELDLLLEYTPDLAARMVRVPLEPPTVPEVRAIVDGWSDWQAPITGRTIGADARRMAIELTGRFLGNRPFPGKALDLLAQARETSRATPELPLGQREVVTRFAATNRVPAALVDPAVRLDLDALRTFLTERLLGQDDALEAVVRMISLIKAGLSDLSRALAVLLFVGPTGVGKTHTAQLLAEYLFGDRQRLVRLNMTDFAGDGAVSQLFGVPGARTLDARLGTLAVRLRGHPFGVLLLDEFEKAHPSVYDAFMQMFDEGRFITAEGEAVAVTSLIVIATSNAGAEVFRESGLGFRGERDLVEMDAELDRRMARIFRYELLNRFDRVVHFHPLDRGHIRGIAARELDRLLQRDGVNNRGLEVEVEPEVVEWLAAHGYHPHFGARFLRREIERNVTAALADEIVRQHPGPGSRLVLGVRGDRVYCRLLPRPAERATVVLPEGATRLDREALGAEAAEWVARWEPLRVESAARRDAASLLIGESAAPGFWADADRAREVLRRYKTLDARLQADERLLGPPRRLAEALESGRSLPLDALAALVEEVAENYARWIALGAAEGGDAAWLVVSSGDPLHPCPAFVAELVAMYRAWIGERGLGAEVVAEEEVGGEAIRAVLEVDGPGAVALLEMERGKHRLRRPDGTIERATVEVLPRGPADRTDPAARVEAARQTRGKLVEKRAARLKVDLPRRGMQVVLVGTDPETLRPLGADLAAAWASPALDLDIARTYAVVGGSARDPRTDAAVASVKDVLRGRLDVFLKAWEAR